MILRGIAATNDCAIDGHLLQRDAVDVTQRAPLFKEHQREIGRVLQMFYHSDANLHVVVETDDADALRLNYFSVAGRPIERAPHGKLFRRHFGITPASVLAYGPSFVVANEKLNVVVHFGAAVAVVERRTAAGSSRTASI